MRSTLRVLHRALKPDNILFSSDVLKLFSSGVLKMGLDVSRIGLGAMSMSGYYNIGAGSDAESIRP
jgi:serine/threonine protein kinase